MAKKRRPEANKPPTASPGEALDGLNAHLRNRSDPPDTIRRAIEAQLEAKTKKRRKSQAPASAGWKRL